MLFLVRHGQTEWNCERRLQGHRDSALTDTGIAQSRAFGRRLQHALRSIDPADLIFVTSPLPRAQHTARLMSETLGCPADWQLEERLREHGYGIWEGLTFEEIGVRYPDDREARERQRWEHTIPQGESLRDVWQRVSQWLAELPQDKVVIAVTHGTTSRVVRGAYLDLPPPDVIALDHHTQDRLFLLSEGRVTPLTCDPSHA